MTAALDQSQQGIASGQSTPGAGRALGESAKSGSYLWQVPSILISIALIGFGLRTAATSGPRHDLEKGLVKVEQLLAEAEYPQAEVGLRTEIEPHLDGAHELQQARFHAAIADLVSLTQQTIAMNDVVHAKVVEHYSRAADLGLELSPARIERWASSALAMNDLRTANRLQSELEAQLRAATDEKRSTLQIARNRLNRAIIQHRLNQPDLNFAQRLQVLTAFRQDESLTVADDVWAVARMTELRLDAGRAQQAVELLLVEIRRFQATPSQQEQVEMGELLTLLGRGYLDLGDYAKAHTHFSKALEVLDGSNPVRGTALCLLGQIAMAQGEHDLAMEKFHLVVQDFVGTSAYFPGLLGRAEVQSILGNHASSLTDYQAVQRLLERQRSAQTRNSQILRAARSMVDRHDAALAVSRVTEALAYLGLAESLFEPDKTPADLLLRLASTNRQLAINRLEQAFGVQSAGSSTAEDPWSSLDSIDPAVRFEVNQYFQKAADYYIRFAAAGDSESQGDDQWSQALWLAADSYDRAGRPDLAIAQFLRYRDSRAVDDPRRGEALFRIAQAHHSQFDFPQAISFYQRVLQDQPRSSHAAQVHVPLAKCYLEVGRDSEAIAQLRQVISGERLLNPQARDYREALFEIGRLHHRNGEFTEAIERFTECVDRYPDDPRHPEMAFYLADSYKGNAAAIYQKTQEMPPVPPSEMARLKGQRDLHLQAALEWYSTVCNEFGSRAHEVSNTKALDMLRRAHLYRADCAFELGLFEHAVNLYEDAARQYSSHPSSMYALVQVVNCYSALGDTSRAQAAHNRAMVRLKQLPDSVFSEGDALMDRAAWERWLENAPLAYVSAVPGGAVHPPDS